jgi:hypothetical protein
MAINYNICNIMLNILQRLRYIICTYMTFRESALIPFSDDCFNSTYRLKKYQIL